MSPVAAPHPVSVAKTTEFEAIYQEYGPLVYRTAWCVLRSAEDAEDVVQAIFLRLLRNEGLPTLQKDPQAYFYRAAINASLDVLKARRRRPFLVGDMEQLDIAAPNVPSGLDDEIRGSVYEAIAQLGAEAAETVLLRYMQNKSLAEIATRMGVSRTVVAVRLFRARAQLRRILRGALENGNEG
jgi:RNA polymerase sigma factor (sigma-70 family)